MHVKEVIVSILDQGDGMDRHELLIAVMMTAPRRPISMDHFDDCLRNLEKANQIRLEGSALVHRVKTPAAA